MSNKKKNKKKKEKITYIDDGRTIADMSGTRGGMLPPPRKKKEKVIPPTGETPWQTYWRSVKMMFLPMLVVLGIICVAFLIFYLLL